MFGNLFDSKPALEITADTVLIDVRSPAEFNGGHIKGAKNWPLDQLADILPKNNAIKEKQIVVYCASGGRSSAAVSLFTRAGYSTVSNGGGIHALAHLGIE